MDKAILAVCLNPVIQKTVVVDHLDKDRVNRASEHRVDASGKGVNVARVLTQTGHRAIHLTQAGGPTKAWFLDLCSGDGLDVRAVESGSEIRFCYTLVDRGDGTATELVEEARPVGAETEDRIRYLYQETLGECRSLIISGTRAPGFSDGLLPWMVSTAKAAGLFVVLDIKGKDLLACLTFGPDIVKPNLEELLATWRLPADAGMDEASIRAHTASIAALLDRSHGTNLVVTRGSKPTWFFRGKALAESPVAQARVLNPTGSGDAFTAGLTAALLDNATLEEAVAEGNRLGGLNAGRLKPGSILPD